MQITCNGVDMEVSEKSSLYDVLLEKEFVDKKGIAVAINNKVIPKANWQNQDLNSNDTILIITATKGG